MTIQKLASEIAKLEGKKSQARIGDIREILGILSDIMADELRGLDVVTTLWVCGCKRNRKKKAAAKNAKR